MYYGGLNGQFIREAARDIPVCKKVNVLVAGSGSAGLSATVCAARNGAGTLLVAGQTISMTYMAREPGPCRGMIPCMHWGQAAGTAAALAVKQGIPPAKLDVQTLRKTLESQDVNLRKDALNLSEVRQNIKRRGATISRIV